MEVRLVLARAFGKIAVEAGSAVAAVVLGPVSHSVALRRVSSKTRTLRVCTRIPRAARIWEMSGCAMARLLVLVVELMVVS